MRITPICLDLKKNLISVLYIYPVFIKPITWLYSYCPDIYLCLQVKSKWKVVKTIAIKRVFFETQTSCATHDGRINPMFPTVSRYFPYSILPIYLPSTWILLIYACSIFKSVTSHHPHFYKVWYLHYLLCHNQCHCHRSPHIHEPKG